MSDATPPPPSTATILGHVSSINGARLNSASVTCNDLVTTALADGAYRFTNLSPASYVLTVTLKGYQSATQTLTITDATTYPVDFQLTKAMGTASITGHVFDSETHHPLMTGTIILILPISNRYSTIKADGSYTFIKLPAGTYKLITSIPEYNDCEHNVELADGESKIQDIYCTRNREVEPAWG
jgi:hypothetical protein